MLYVHKGTRTSQASRKSKAPFYQAASGVDGVCTTSPESRPVTLQLLAARIASYICVRSAMLAQPGVSDEELIKTVSL